MSEPRETRRLAKRDCQGASSRRRAKYRHGRSRRRSRGSFKEDGTGFVLPNTNACRETNPMHKLRILILYPDPAGLALLTSMLKSLGHIIEEATNDRVAVRLMERNNIDLVLAGVDPLDDEALELLTYVRRKHREVPVILLFPRLHPERAKEALRLGAMAVLKYPVPAAELRAAVLQALERCEARAIRAGAAPLAAAPTDLAGASAVPSTEPQQPTGDSPAAPRPRSAIPSPRTRCPAVPAARSRRADGLGSAPARRSSRSGDRLDRQ